MFWKIRVREYQLGLCFHDGDLVGLLEPGAHRIDRRWRAGVEIVDQLDTRFHHPRLATLLRSDLLKAKLEFVQLRGTERALVWKDARLAYILGPGPHALWREPWRLVVDKYDVDEVVLRHPRGETIMAHVDAPLWLERVEVGNGEEVWLMDGGRVVGLLRPGRHLLWRTAHPVGRQKYECHLMASEAVMRIT